MLCFNTPHNSTKELQSNKRIWFEFFGFSVINDCKKYKKSASNIPSSNKARNFMKTMKSILSTCVEQKDKKEIERLGRVMHPFIIVNFLQ